MENDITGKVFWDDAAQDEGTLHYGHPRMPLSERAKIFTPFNPLRGFHDELRRREELVEAAQHHEPWLPEDDLPEGQ